MSTPWEILGLDPETVDADALRRAYVRLVKRHRPDRDPKRFQAIREAYETARRILELADHAGLPIARFDVLQLDGHEVLVTRDEASDEDDATADAPDMPDAPDVPDEPAVEVSATAASFVDPLPPIRAALEAGDEAEASQLLREAHARWRNDQDDAGEFADLVDAVPDAYVRAVGDDAAAEDALRASESGEGPIFAAVVGAWTRRGAWARIRALAERLLARAETPTPSPPSMGFALGTCASTLALADPPYASRLAEAAHRELAGPWRERALHEADVRLAMAGELAGVPEGDRRELTRLLAGGGETPAVGPAFLALRKAMLEADPEGLTSAVLAERFPDAAKHVRHGRRLAGETHRRARRRERGSHTWAWIFIAMAAMGMFRLIAKQGREVERWRLEDPLGPETLENTHRRTQDALRDLDEILERIRTRRPSLDQVRAEVLRDAVYAPEAADATLRGEGALERGSHQHYLLLTQMQSDPNVPLKIRLRCKELLRAITFDER